MANENTEEVAPAFVFVAQVLAQGAATMDEIAIDGATYVVGVLQTMASPEAVGDLAGFEVTVRHEPADLQVGDLYLVHAHGWLFGEGLGVVAVSAESFDPDAATAVAEELEAAPMVAQQSRINDAELVVSGRIVSLKEVKPKAGTPITEHDPMWCEAVIEVATVEHAADDKKPKKVTVRFAASDDADWVRAPKFTVGDQRVFMLGSRSSASEEAQMMSGAKPNQYTVVQAEDALPIEHLEHVRATMEGG